MYRVRHLQDRHVHSTRKVGSSPMEGCLACDLSEGRMYLPGALIAETEGWRVEHTVGPLGVGTLIVKPKRHVVHVAGLSSQEAAELGPLIRQAAAVVTELTDPERSTSHLGRMRMLNPGRIHWVLQPVTRAQMDHFDGYGPTSRSRCSIRVRSQPATR